MDFDNSCNTYLESDCFTHFNEVVAAVLTNEGQIALFQRSQKVHGDRGLWHCITGFLSPCGEPEEEARKEIYEEACLNKNALKLIGGCLVELTDEHGQLWKVHAFHYESRSRKLNTNWENDNAKWVSLNEMNQVPTVAWLTNVLCSLSIKNYVDLQ